MLSYKCIIKYDNLPSLNLICSSSNTEDIPLEIRRVENSTSLFVILNKLLQFSLNCKQYVYRID